MNFNFVSCKQCHLCFQHYGLFQSKKSKLLRLSTAQKKILVSLCYYVVMAVVSITSYTISLRNADPFATHLRNYFSCEAPGHNPDALCDRSPFRQLANPEISTIGHILLALIPLANLVYVLNARDVKVVCGVCCRKRRKSKTKAVSGSSNMKSSQMELGNMDVTAS